MNKLNTISNLSYDQYISLCIDNDFISDITSSLSISKTNVRLLLSSFVFKYFQSEIMIVNSLSVEDQEIIRISENLISSINQDNFITLLNDYTIHLQRWKDFDKPRVIKPFINKYKTLRTIRDKPFYFYYKKELDTLIDFTFLQLITMINSLGGDSSLLELDSILDFDADNELIKEFISSSKETFWSVFRESGEYTKTILLLIDFANRYKLLIPNRIDLLEQMSEVLDIEFIHQQITNNISFDNITRYMVYIIQKLKEVDMPSEDLITDEWFNTLKNSTRAVSDPIYFLQTFFEYVLNRLDILLEVLNELRPNIQIMYENKNNDYIIE